MSNELETNKVEIFESEDGIILNVQLSNETVWLNQEQLSVLFQRNQSVISRHLANVFKEGELSKESNMQKVHIANSDKPVSLYNLDVIISVGYRVKSLRGTQFRQWATKRLKDYLIEGLAISEMRLNQKNKELEILHNGIRIFSRALEAKLENIEPYSWLQRFKMGLQLLDDYDNELLDLKGRHSGEIIYPTMREYQKIIKSMSIKYDTYVFGKEKDNGFKSAVNQIKQSLGEEDAYPSTEEKASMLLYLIVKNHAFVDGNKRIAAACFLLFLERNNLLFHKSGQPIISNEAIASLTLFIATSKANEMETVKKLLISVLNRTNVS